ncbi:hypothetical protein L218DRAFT_1010706 [Marasmius fiardii PR-910]|nr:hypothetical protein L218DRAFT_1010706 [Marasmius fiardii PR-910]
MGPPCPFQASLLLALFFLTSSPSFVIGSGSPSFIPPTHRSLPHILRKSELVGAQGLLRAFASLTLTISPEHEILMVKSKE